MYEVGNKVISELNCRLPQENFERNLVQKGNEVWEVLEGKEILIFGFRNTTKVLRMSDGTSEKLE